MSRAEYVALLKDLLSRDPAKIRAANQKLYAIAVQDPSGSDTVGDKREADLVLAEIAD